MLKSNTEMHLTPAVIEQLEIGTVVFTNGDGNLATQNYFEGKVVAKDTNVLYIMRSDGEQGGGVNGEWVIRATGKSDTRLFVHVLEEPKPFDGSPLAFGDVLKVDSRIFPGELTLLYVETLTTGVHVFIQTRGWTVTTTKVERTNEELAGALLLGKMPFLKCNHHNCNKQATISIVLPSVTFLCAEHAPTEIGKCSDCGTSSYPEALVRHTTQARGSRPRVTVVVCPSCYELRRMANVSIQTHSYKPRPQFIRVAPMTDDLRTKLFAGVECEVECPYGVGGEVSNLITPVRRSSPVEMRVSGDWGQCVATPSPPPRRRSAEEMNHPFRLAKVLTKRFNKPMKWFYLKSDGSLSNGFELVTEPATVEAHKALLPWERVFGFMKAQGIEADQTTSCGLHIHVNKNYLPEDHRIRLGYFVNSQKSAMEALARRTQSDYAKFKPANTPMDHYALNTLGGKYEALNWSPRETVEFRLFRGTVEHGNLMSSLELVEALILFTTNQTITELKKKTASWVAFTEFVKHNGYDFLPEYMVTKGVA